MAGQITTATRLRHRARHHQISSDTTTRQRRRQPRQPHARHRRFPPSVGPGAIRATTKNPTGLRLPSLVRASPPTRAAALRSVADHATSQPRRRLEGRPHQRPVDRRRAGALALNTPLITRSRTAPGRATGRENFLVSPHGRRHWQNCRVASVVMNDVAGQVKSALQRIPALDADGLATRRLLVEDSVRGRRPPL